MIANERLQNTQSMTTEKQSTYEQNAKERYEALGRFVEAFEAMVW